MTRPLRIKYPGGFYYISQHSNSGNAIFKKDADYNVFLEILETSGATYNVNFHGFVLLKDHYHLIAETPLANISEFMKNINIRYTSYFNRSHKRKGHLFGGRFKSVIFEEEHYLSKVSHYLHLNPVKKGAIKRRPKEMRAEHLSQYRWSSLPGFMGNYPRYTFIAHHLVLQPYGGDTPQGRKNYTETLYECLDNGFQMKKEIIGQAILGSIPFVQKMKETFSANADSREMPELKKIKHYLMQEKVLEELERGLRCTREQLINSPTDIRSIAMDMLYRFGGLTNPEIGNIMGLDYSSISLGRKRISNKRKSDLMLDAKMTLLEKRLLRIKKSEHEQIT